MIRQPLSGEHGGTPLQFIVIAVVLIVAGYVAFTIISGEIRQTGPSEGISGSLVRETGFALDHTGPVTALSAVDGNYSGVPIQFSSQNATNLGAVQMTVALFMGDAGSIDFDKVSLWWISGTVAERIPRKTTSPLVCPGWMITGKYGTPGPAPSGSGSLPASIPRGSTGQPARASNGTALAGDDILRPGEQFGLLICPTNSTPPYQKFSILANPPGATEPPVAIISAPPMDHPVVIIGSE